MFKEIKRYDGKRKGIQSSIITKKMILQKCIWDPSGSSVILNMCITDA